jgi:hypothetical protein
MSLWDFRWQYLEQLQRPTPTIIGLAGQPTIHTRSREGPMDARLVALANNGLVGGMALIQERRPNRIAIIHLDYCYGRTEYWALFGNDFDFFLFMPGEESRIVNKDALLVRELIGKTASIDELAALFKCRVEENWVGYDES